MADDLADAEARAATHAGLENDEIGWLLARMIRQLRALTTQVRDLKQRVDRLDPPAG